MEKSTLILILVLVFILLFATRIQYYTGQAIKTWFRQVDYCSDSDNGFFPFVSGKVEYPYQTRTYTYTDTCSGNKLTEGTCKNQDLIKITFTCPHGCAGHGADNHGACICEKDRECPESYRCVNGECMFFSK